LDLETSPAHQSMMISKADHLFPANHFEKLIFVNPPHLKSIPTIHHAHMFVRNRRNVNNHQLNRVTISSNAHQSTIVDDVQKRSLNCELQVDRSWKCSRFQAEQQLERQQQQHLEEEKEKLNHIKQHPSTNYLWSDSPLRRYDEPIMSKVNSKIQPTDRHTGMPCMAVRCGVKC
jgi:hypothetical protein